MLSVLTVKNRLDKAAARENKRKGAMLAGLFFVFLGLFLLAAAYFLVR